MKSKFMQYLKITCAAFIILISNAYASENNSWWLSLFGSSSPNKTNTTLNDRISLNMNTNWLYIAQDVVNGQSTSLDDSKFVQVSVPHANTVLPKHLDIDVNDYRFTSWYRRYFSLESQYSKSRVSIEFQGVATVADIYVNGTYVTQHKGAYTSFSVDITDHLKFGNTKNVIAVKVDSTRHADVPPEGGKVDYALFGGIVRDVTMVITNPVHIARTFVSTSDVTTKSALINTKTLVINKSNQKKSLTISAIVTDNNGELIVQSSKNTLIAVGESKNISVNSITILKPHLWDIDDPYLYNTKIVIKDDNQILDTYSVPTGIRTFKFTKKGFYLNGRTVELFGLNRHEQWPWIGRAAPNRLQKRDADIIKYELGNNIVRLSHYPQDPEFIQRADEIGLLILEELPGWQHIGDEAWQLLVKNNLKEMILRDRNHPSIISWGVRINESKDSSSFYKDTNAIALKLDPTRPTHGVRTNENPDGEYQENGFYGYNDYNCWDNSTEVKPPRDIPWLITETNCKWKTVLPNSTDTAWVIHMKEFARIHQSAVQNPKILGSIAWSYVDYNTEEDYNNTNNIFYSGVYDIFRLPRFSASFYKSQQDPKIYGPMLDIASFWTAESPTKVTIASNTEEVELFVNDISQGKIRANVYTGLSYPLFEFPVKFQSGKLSARGYINGKIVAADSVNTPGKAVRLELIPDSNTIIADGSDLTSITIRAVDIDGNWVPYATPSVSLTVNSTGKILGENPITLENGRASLFVQSILNKTGNATITATATGLKTGTTDVNVDTFTDAIVPVSPTIL
ncbi:MAG: DUF4982 domain-containing protein [Colwellia sp.]